ncbi:MAG: hypothetical protein HOP07_01330 [Bacteriovoracaceae bacterium]|nr:hypothetical protein [Bacteriovoracaceae bacterium]
MKIFHSSLLIVILMGNSAYGQTSLNYLPENQMPPTGMYGGAGAYPGMGARIGGGSFQTGNQGESIPIFENGGSGQYKSVKVNSKCPLLTSTSKEDTDLFSDLKNFLSTASKQCSLSQSMNQNDPMMPNQAPNVSLLETMINGGSDSSGYGMETSVTGTSVKCYTQNVELIGQRNLAYYYVEKKMTASQQSPFYSCLTLTDEMMMPVSVEKQKECVAKKYESLVEENKIICKEINAPKAIQAQINKGLMGVEDILNQAIANKDECGFKSQDLFKVTMNTFLKAKALSVVGPWGAVAGFGADLVGNLLDKLFPSDAQKAADLMNEILSEETFEQNACLYYNIQQKMYCEERPVEIAAISASCQNIVVNNDLLKLIQKYKDIKKVTDAYATPNSSWSSTPDRRMPSGAQEISPAFESELLDHMDELSNYAVANEESLRERVKTLPKIQQGREQAKIDHFIGKMKEYQNYDPTKDATGEAAKKLVGEIANLFTANSWDVSMFVVRTTSGTKLENLKQRSIARTIEELMASRGEDLAPNESSRTMARFNKYKNGITTLAKSKFEGRLEKQFKEFETQVKFVASKDNGVIKDSVAEGQLRNLVRHCSLLQEVYDPNLEGKMPKVCEKLSCNNNKLNWFQPKATQANFSQFKQNYCDKSLSFQRTENEFIKELKNPSGAKICGVRAESFF